MKIERARQIMQEKMSECEKLVKEALAYFENVRRQIDEHATYIKTIGEIIFQSHVEPPPRRTRARRSRTQELRVNSDIAKAHTLLSEKAEPMHIDQIIRSLGMTEDKKMSLLANIQRYARWDKFFRKVAPCTYIAYQRGNPMNN